VGGALPAEIWREVVLAAFERTPPPAPPVGTVGDAETVTAAIDSRQKEDLIGKMLAQETPDQRAAAPSRGETTVKPSGRIVVRPPPAQ
jgi:hypothetical protein